jgi:putative NADH-flavin reductase
MSAVLVGASRGIGLETVKVALKAGHSVRAMARSASAIRLRDPKLEKLDCDALDQRTVERALAGVDPVIQTLGVSPTPALRNAPVFRRHSCSGQCDGGKRG